MSIEAIINNDIKQAMLARDQQKLEALRAVKAAILLEKTKKGAESGDLDDALAIGILQRLVKQRKESAEIYRSNGRTALLETELAQASVIEKYLPEQVSDETLQEEVKKVISETGASGMKDMGKVMGIVTKKFAGKADNKKIANLVRSLLNG